MKDMGKVSDGYHTFNELYEHRHMLFRALCNVCPSTAWKSKIHADGSSIKGWFIAGLITPKGEEITYHIPIRLWKMFQGNQTFPKAPVWDGHTSKDVLERLKNF